MDCPRCKAPASADAVFCGVCQEPFEKPKKPAAPRRIVIEDVECRVGRIALTGVLFVEDGGLYFFVDRAERRLNVFLRLAGLLIGQAAGPLGGILTDKAMEELCDRDSSELPFELVHRDEASAIYDHRTSAANRIIQCRYCFTVERAEIGSAAIPEDDVLEIGTTAATLELHGDFEEAAVSGKLRLWGYPVTDTAGGWGPRRVLKALFALLAIGGLVLDIKEFGHLHRAVSALRDHSLVKTVFYEGEYFRKDMIILSAFVFAIVGYGLFSWIQRKVRDA